ncbi:MAG: InlB B-repeat-containing protein [Eubacterium sp.]|nr:InlB B-repeat-containing protein [Eubacterium sp.]
MRNKFLLVLMVLTVIVVGGYAFPDTAEAYSVSSAYSSHRVWTKKSDNNNFFVKIYNEDNKTILDSVRFNVWAESSNISYDKITGYRDANGKMKTDVTSWNVSIGGSGHSNNNIPMKIYDLNKGKAITNGEHITIKTRGDINKRNLILYIPVQVELKEHRQYQVNTVNDHKKSTDNRFNFYEYITYNDNGDNTLLKLKHNKQGSGEKYICYLQVNLINTGAITNEDDKKRYNGCEMSFAIEKPVFGPKVKYVLNGFTKKDLSSNLITDVERSSEKNQLITRIDSTHGRKTCTSTPDKLGSTDMTKFYNYVSASDNTMPSYIVAENKMRIAKTANAGNKYIGESTSVMAYYETGKIYLCPYNRDVSLYFKPKQYNIEYKLNGGVNSKDNANSYNILYPVRMYSPVKTGYTFLYWKDGSGNTYGGTKGDKKGINMETTNSSLTPDNWKTQLNKRSYGNKTMTAAWKENSYTIRYNSDSTSKDTEDVKVKYTEEHSVKENMFVKSGYRFLGWSKTPVTDYENTGGDDVDYMPGKVVSKLSSEDNGIVNLYAVWSKNQPPVINAPKLTTKDGNKINPFTIKNSSGGKTLVIQKGDKFTPLYYQTARDKEDGDVTKKVVVKSTDLVLKDGRVMESGRYKVCYEVEDSSGNKAEKTITVIVNDPPKITTDDKPVKTIIGSKLEWYDLFSKDYAGVSIKDKEDGDIENEKIKILSIDGNKELLDLNVLDDTEGRHVIRISVTDSMKGTTEKECVVETVKVVFKNEIRYPRFIDGDSLDTLEEKSIWLKNSEYREVLVNSLNNENPVRYEI